jgi:hypothetical protein
MDLDGLHSDILRGMIPRVNSKVQRFNAHAALRRMNGNEQNWLGVLGDGLLALCPVRTLALAV